MEDLDKKSVLRILQENTETLEGLGLGSHRRELIL